MNTANRRVIREFYGFRVLDTEGTVYLANCTPSQAIPGIVYHYEDEELADYISGILSCIVSLILSTGYVKRNLVAEIYIGCEVYRHAFVVPQYVWSSEYFMSLRRRYGGNSRCDGTIWQQRYEIWKAVDKSIQRHERKLRQRQRKCEMT